MTREINHTHCYRKYPPTHWKHFVTCVPDVVLQLGDEIDLDGEKFFALPTWDGDVIKVMRDQKGACVATPATEEPCIETEEKRELVSTGYAPQTWQGPS